jgi:hypothetical protein
MPLKSLRLLAVRAVRRGRFRSDVGNSPVTADVIVFRAEIRDVSLALAVQSHAVIGELQ